MTKRQKDRNTKRQKDNKDEGKKTKRQKDERQRLKGKFNITTSGQFRTLAMFYVFSAIHLFVCLLVTWLSLVRSESKTGMVTTPFTFFTVSPSLLAHLAVAVFKIFLQYQNEILTGCSLT